MRTQVLTFIYTLASAAAAGGTDAPPQTVRRGDPNASLVSIIRSIMPGSDTCDGASKPAECRTAEQAAPFLIRELTNRTAGEIAGMLALIGLESMDMRYKYNLVHEGQGTCNMMMADFVSEYAIERVGTDAVTGKSMKDVLDLVAPDEHNFGSAAWYFDVHCDEVQKASLRAGTDQGWVDYNTCVGVNGSLPERKAYWDRAKAAFGLWT